MRLRARNRSYRLILLLIAALLVLPSAGPVLVGAEENEVSKTDAQANVERAKRETEEYYGLLMLFADTLDQIERNYVKDISRRELMEAAIRGMLEKLDQYSNYIPPDEIARFKSTVESEFGGIGIQISIEDGVLTVISPLVGSPAYKAGLMAGDKIIKIEDESTKGITLDEAVRKLKGKVGTKVEVTVEHAHDAKVETVELTRDIIHVETVLGHHRKDNDTWSFFSDDESKIAYIRVTAFTRHTADELREVLAKLTTEGMRGLVLDLRFNPGGLLSSAIEVSDLFVEGGRIVSTAGRNSPERVWDAHKKGTFTGFPIAIVVNRYSASASEIVAACLQDHDRAAVIGERTFGKGSVQNIIDLENGKSALKLTTAGYVRPSGKNIHRFDGAKDEDDWGVRPNDGFEVKFSNVEMRQLLEDRRHRDIVGGADEPDETNPDEEPYVDRQFAKAVEYLKKEMEGADRKAAEADTARAKQAS